jgi:hypothetical protein
VLTVHKLPLTHLFLADNQTAKEAREVGIMEALVVIDRGLVVSVNTPPAGLDEFGSDEDWIARAIEDAYRRGAALINVYDAEEIVTPEGWTHWRDLTPGTVATSGSPHEAAAIMIGGPMTFKRDGHRAFNALTLSGLGHLSSAFQHNPASPPPWPFYKVLRAGLSGEQIHHLAAAVESGEDIEEALARLAPLAA